MTDEPIKANSVEELIKLDMKGILQLSPELRRKLAEVLRDETERGK